MNGDYSIIRSCRSDFKSLVTCNHIQLNIPRLVPMAVSTVIKV